MVRGERATVLTEIPSNSGYSHPQKACDIVRPQRSWSFPVTQVSTSHLGVNGKIIAKR